MQQPQPQPMMPVMPSYPSNITTEQIQKYLEENKKLILAILDNQNLGKLAECAQYQALLQKNLMYLAAIADAQPPAPSVPQQMAPPHPSMQQGGFFMQHPQAAAAAMAQQQQQLQQQQQQQQSDSGFFPQRAQMQFNSPHQLQPQDPQMHHQLLQHQAMQGQMGGGMRPNNGGLYHQMQQHSEAALGGNKQDHSTDDQHHGQGNSAAERSEDPK